MSFKVGDRVVYTGTRNNVSRSMVGTIVRVRTSNVYGVEFDEHVDGHDCDGYARLGHGWCVVDFDLRLESDKTIGRNVGGSKLEFVWP